MFKNPSWFPTSQHTIRLSAWAALFCFCFVLICVSSPPPALSLVHLPTISWLFSPVVTFLLIPFLFISAQMFHCLSPKSYHAFVPPRPGLVSLFSCPFISSLISWIWPVLLFLSDYLLSWFSFVCLCFDLSYRLQMWIKLNKNCSCTCVHPLGTRYKSTIP